MHATPLTVQEGWPKSLALYKTQRWNVLSISLPQFPTQLLPEEETMRYCLCVCERQSAFHSNLFVVVVMGNFLIFSDCTFKFQLDELQHVFKHLLFILHFIFG